MLSVTGLLLATSYTLKLSETQNNAMAVKLKSVVLRFALIPVR